MMVSVREILQKGIGEAESIKNWLVAKMLGEVLERLVRLRGGRVEVGEAAWGQLFPNATPASPR